MRRTRHESLVDHYPSVDLSTSPTMRTHEIHFRLLLRRMWGVPIMLAFLALVILIVLVVLAALDIVPWVPHVLIALIVVVILFLVEGVPGTWRGFRRR